MLLGYGLIELLVQLVDSDPCALDNVLGEFTHNMTNYIVLCVAHAVVMRQTRCRSLV
jgi:hypothetical protein